MDATRFKFIKEMVVYHGQLFICSDFREPHLLDESEYFRGQVNLIADMVGVIDTTDVLWAPLRNLCVAQARGEDDRIESLRETVFQTIKEHVEANKD